MSLEAFFKGMAICTELEKRRIAGVSEICPSNASYLVRFDPDVIHPDKMLRTLKEIEAEIGDAELDMPTRIVEIPVLYNDPWTHETLMRFRERHQDPNSTDIEYARPHQRLEIGRRIHRCALRVAPWFVSMVGFVAGLPFMFQMVEREKQIEVPKYLRPRTDTPKLTVGHGGCFAAIYSVRGAGGYQLFGITPGADLRPGTGAAVSQATSWCSSAPATSSSGSRSTREEYDRDVKAVEAGTFRLDRSAGDVSRSKAFHADPGGYSRRARSRCEVLHGH